MYVFAFIEGGTVANIQACDDQTFAGLTGWVDITQLDPRPDIGWTTADGGQTFNPPPPPPPSAQQTATVTVQQMSTQFPAKIAQSQADATTIAGLQAGQPLTADQVAAMQRSQSGWPELLAGLQALVIAAGFGPA